MFNKITRILKRNWEQQYETTLEIQASNLVIQTDGGLRDGQCAASAWVIGLWGESRYEPLIAHGTVLDCSTTVFAAEAIALDEATAKVKEILRGL